MKRDLLKLMERKQSDIAATQTCFEVSDWSISHHMTSRMHSAAASFTSAMVNNMCLQAESRFS